MCRQFYSASDRKILAAGQKVTTTVARLLCSGDQHFCLSIFCGLSFNKQPQVQPQLPFFSRLLTQALAACRAFYVCLRVCLNAVCICICKCICIRICIHICAVDCFRPNFLYFLFFQCVCLSLVQTNAVLVASCC